ncbi:hypothetical protein H5410_004916 [Solanum commersonii]|uniref:Polyprotein protein n=1 Tax=Solanum commersonii TaxID=4109 RepID=A0A9J6A5P4_SOLCO|nr:hypothetical protein H5410_004916 [Solanum commersonii]
MGHLTHFIDVQATRLEAESIGATSEMTTLKDEVSYLRKDVEYIKSTNFNSLFEAAETQGVSGSSEMPLTTTGDVPMEDVATNASEAETDEE